MTIIKDAVFSEDRVHRYRLTRYWHESILDPRAVCFIGLNPSTADETVDDPTIRRCMNFAREWGYDGIVMVNLWAYRATDPKNLMKAADMCGAANDPNILKAAQESSLVVAAWGTSYTNPRCREVSDLLERAEVELYCLGLTKHGEPRHPLYLRADTVPMAWEGCTH